MARSLNSLLELNASEPGLLRIAMASAVPIDSRTGPLFVVLFEEVRDR